MKLKDIKNNFEKREIAPSADSWQRLSRQLDQADKKKKRPYMFWICAVAAIAVIALMISQTSQLNTGDTPVINSVTTIEKEADKTDSTIMEPVVITKKTPVVEKTSVANSNTTDRLTATVMSTNKKTRRVIHENAQAASKKITVNPVLVEVDAMDSNKINNLTLVQETDLLLKEALAKAEPEQIVTKSIKADQLLRETEWDIEAERRNRLNNGIKSGFSILKVEAFALIGVDR